MNTVLSLGFSDLHDCWPGNRALARAVGTPGVEATGPEFERHSAQDFHPGYCSVRGVCVRVCSGVSVAVWRVSRLLGQSCLR